MASVAGIMEGLNRWMELINRANEEGEGKL